MKKFLTLLALLPLIALCACNCDCDKTDRLKQPRKIAVQMFSTHDFYFDEAAERLAKLGVKYIECYPGQKLSRKFPKAKFNYNMDDEQKAFVKKLLKDLDMKIIAFGCTGAKDENGVRKICKFADEFAIKTIVTEAKEDTIPVWDKVCGEYGQRMALHSHESKPDNPAYRHFDPKFLMTLIKDYKNVGICADNGAWSRSGLDVVEGFKTVKGKLYEIHLKDQKTIGDRRSGCTAYGEGALDMKAILAEIDSQNFDGFFIIEDGTYHDSFPVIEKNLVFLRNN